MEVLRSDEYANKRARWAMPFDLEHEIGWERYAGEAWKHYYYSRHPLFRNTMVSLCGHLEERIKFPSDGKEIEMCPGCMKVLKIRQDIVEKEK